MAEEAEEAAGQSSPMATAYVSLPTCEDGHVWCAVPESLDRSTLREGISGPPRYQCHSLPLSASLCLMLEPVVLRKPSSASLLAWTDLDRRTRRWLQPMPEETEGRALVGPPSITLRQPPGRHDS